MMKKKLLALTLAFVMALSTGCGQSDSNKEKTKEDLRKREKTYDGMEPWNYNFLWNSSAGTFEWSLF